VTSRAPSRAPSLVHQVTALLASTHVSHSSSLRRSGGARTIIILLGGFIDRGSQLRNKTRHPHSAASPEAHLHPGSFVLAVLLSFEGPFFPSSLVPNTPRADTRRCVVSAQAAHSDCALIGAQWVVTTAGAVASARPVAGRLQVRIGDDEYTVDQLVYHPKWNGGLKYDVTLLRLTDRVPAFPLRPPPGEFPEHVERVAQRAMGQHEWIAQTIGPSPVWDARPGAPKQSALMSRVRSIMDGLAGRTSND
jgi:hypothetical protein